MKLNKTLKFISVGLIVLAAVGCTETSKTGDQSDKNNLLLLSLLNRTTENSEARKYCANAVIRMNQCIGSNSGFNPAVMCSDGNLKADIAADAAATPPVVAQTSVEMYQALIKCVDSQIAATNCNFTQNKVATPNQAKSAFFSKCDVPSGIIITVF
ncbi:MAG: hypothetical protein IPQ05_16560 [Leptospiraceae bacterium]|jgi:hypothetical protein|nr:hypothetical protein [Leptospiraceae bacterium]MBK7057668.1 hypothetical protein [Leptospiraceae bacterium]MBK9500751.1 hypothetical protein [Leptospiraceae bacterium]MBL0265426.1 hypothetical protein [Leptospiraceae bacterium]HRG48356.1 hypothetical protein [Leptospiraceae bacterium]